MTTNSTPSVTQADREAAADYWQIFIARPGECIVGNQMRRGGLDGMESVQAFARHRTQAEAASAARIADLEKEIDALRFMQRVVEDPDRQLCCDGRECGCMGSTVGQYAAWAFKDEAASAATIAELVEVIEGLADVLERDCECEPCIGSMAPGEHFLGLARALLAKVKAQAEGEGDA